MIVVDGSALFAVLLDEEEGQKCEAALVGNVLAMSAGSYAEALIVAAGKRINEQFRAFFDGLSVEVFPLTPERAEAAADAYRRWGKGFHNAKLNLAYSFAYALARELGLPLLHTGDDFAMTDIRSALA